MSAAIETPTQVAHTSTARALHSVSAGRFLDERSRKQIAAYLAHRLRVNDERNERALARWNSYLRQQWEIERLGVTRRIAAIARPSSFPERECRAAAR